jgi:hypothetical protein
MSWESVAVCVKCWDKRNPDRKPVVITSPIENCHFCDAWTNAGIYVRAEVKNEK